MPETHFFEQQDGSKIAYKIFESHESENIYTSLEGLLFTYLVSLYLLELEKENQSVISFDDLISIDLIAQDIIALVKHLEIKRFNLLGWSMGGLIATFVALNILPDLNLEKLMEWTNKVSSLLIHDEADEIVPIEDSELLDREIPNTKFLRIPKVGHMIELMWDGFADFIDNFLHDDII
ncbi:Alpha/Beta hydrolase protein [Glomus cerebriforme]|uniref:Alpha/Beta hydrolase protein n=1 Tax=Glomus cerebriforme TaxID=658196 RepID=A0A397T141_9GLOM|nr:Alpha/Beta hydrolase protein [Glomus cerebriforme]